MSIATEITRLQNAKASIKTAIENKGVTVPSDSLISSYSTYIDDIPTGSASASLNDVNFYDSDGSILYSYTKDEFLALSSLPDNPTKDWLIPQGWTYTLSNAKTYVTNYGKLNIGQMYSTPNGSTRLYINLQDGRLSPYLKFAINGSATIDWGDNSTPSVVTGSSTSTYINTLHNYTNAGNYIITITPTSTLYLGSSDSAGLLNKNSSVFAENTSYLSCINKLYLGNVYFNTNEVLAYMYNVNEVVLSTQISSDFRYYIFQQCGLKHITIPTNISRIDYAGYIFSECRALSSVCFPSNLQGSIDGYAFNECVNLDNVTLPIGISSIGNTAFYNCWALRYIIIPNNMITSIGNMALYGCRSLNSLTLPPTITQYNDSCFQACYGMKYYDFSSYTAIPNAGSYIFSNIPSDCKIIVPDDLYSSWVSRSNWSNYSSYIIKKSDWDNL